MWPGFGMFGLATRDYSGAGGSPLPTYVDNLTEFLMKTKAGRNGKLIYVLTTPSADIKVRCPQQQIKEVSCLLLHSENHGG